jgi:hypothetical protein
MNEDKIKGAFNTYFNSLVVEILNRSNMYTTQDNQNYGADI